MIVNLDSRREDGLNQETVQRAGLNVYSIRRLNDAGLLLDT